MSAFLVESFTSLRFLGWRLDLTVRPLLSLETPDPHSDSPDTVHAKILSWVPYFQSVTKPYWGCLQMISWVHPSGLPTITAHPILSHRPDTAASSTAPCLCLWHSNCFQNCLHRIPAACLNSPGSPFLSHWICFNPLTVTCKSLQSLVTFLPPLPPLSKHISNTSDPVQDSTVKFHRWENENKHANTQKAPRMKKGECHRELSGIKFGLQFCPVAYSNPSFSEPFHWRGLCSLKSPDSQGSWLVAAQSVDCLVSGKVAISN